MAKNRHTVIPRTMCFVLYQDKVLLLKAGKTKAWSGKYGPLGGHIEKGEDIIRSANREIYEESGLKVKGTRLRGVVHVTNFYGQNILMFVTLSRVLTDQVTANHEGDLHWVRINSLDKFNLLPDVKFLFERAIKSGKPLFTATSEFDTQGNLLYLRFD